MGTLKTIYILFKSAFIEWRRDRASCRGAALAYYAVFSLSPALIIMIAAAGLLFGRQAAEGKILTQVQTVFAPEVAVAVQQLLEAARRPSAGIFATLVGVLILLVGATGVLVELQDGLNSVWEVQSPPRPYLFEIIKTRLVSLGILLGGGFLLLGSLVLSTGLSTLEYQVSREFSGWIYFGQAVDLIVSFGLATLLFAMIFKYVPDSVMRWSDVWVGAAVTAFLFTIGKVLIGFVIGKSAVSSIYGAAGSLVALLIWIYYSSQIFFFGAEFTQVYAERMGSRLLSRGPRIHEYAASRYRTERMPKSQ
jgi:membrane protein